MSHAQQDPAAASAPFDSTARSVASRTRAHDTRSVSRAIGAAVPTLAQHQPAESRIPAQANAQTEPREITVVVKRFAFEPARVEAQEGERIRLVVSSADGVHGVEIKKFKINKKVPRGGDQVTIDFVASAPGEYPILCSEYCGNGHEEMKGTLVVAAKGTPR